MPRLNDMALFAEVVAAQGFSAAAKRTGLSASALSKHIAALEATLGVTLLQRSTRHLRLTEAGALFYARCQRMLAEAEAAEQAVRQFAAEPGGTLRVAAPSAFGALHVAPALTPLLARYPTLRVQLLLDDRLPTQDRAAVDVAVHFGEPQDSSLHLRRLARSEEILCAAPSYLQQHGAPSALAALADRVCLPRRDAAGEVWRVCDGGRPAAVRVAGPLAVDDLHAQRAAALAGIGIAKLPRFLIIDDLHLGRLRRLLPGVAAAVEVWALYPAQRAPLPAVRAFIDTLIERFARTDWSATDSDGQRGDDSIDADAPPARLA